MSELFVLDEGLKFWVRSGTNDHNTVYASVKDDEYNLADEDVDGKLVFDVGAYLGSVGIWLATRGAEVICIEPVPANASLIWRNASLNRVLDRVHVEEVAAGSPGTTQVVRWGFSSDPTWNDRVAVVPELGDIHTDQTRLTIEHHRFVGVTDPVAPVDQLFEEKTVPSVSLAEMVAIYGLPDIIKLDCEGGEWPWFAEPIIHSVRLLVGEWHPHGVDRLLRSYTRETIEALLGETHDLTFDGPEGGPGGFRATRK